MVRMLENRATGTKANFSAQTGTPLHARTNDIPIVRRNVLLPAMLAPVTMAMLFLLRVKLLGTGLFLHRKGWYMPSALIITSEELSRIVAPVFSGWLDAYVARLVSASNSATWPVQPFIRGRYFLHHLSKSTDRTMSYISMPFSSMYITKFPLWSKRLSREASFLTASMLPCLSLNRPCCSSLSTGDVNWLLPISSRSPR